MTKTRISLVGSPAAVNLRYEDYSQGSKNATLPLIGASLIFDNRQVLSNFPDISDARSIFGLLEQAGVKFDLDKAVFSKDRSSLEQCSFGSNFFDTRGGFYVVAGIIEKLRTIDIIDCFVGGCQIGDRNYGFIFDTFRAFGIDVAVSEKNIVFRKTKQNVASRIVLDDLGIVVTGIALILAAQQDKSIELVDASCASEINDLIDFLGLNGVHVERRGARNLLVNPTMPRPVHAVEYRIQDDRVVIATYIVLSLISNGKFTIEKSKLEYLGTFIELLVAIGYKVEERDSECAIYRENGSVLKPQDAIVDDYPAISTDIQPLLTVLLCSVSGRSTVSDKIFPTRNFHVGQLNKLNQHIAFKNDQILIDGGSAPISNNLVSNDMRCSAALLLAASISTGTSTIENWENVNRGYEHLLTILSLNNNIAYTQL
jgi:UDP-N-acetylglucosamine 1-carboxyvinyltransferase